MDPPTLVEVDDLSPAGSLETGSPSVYSDMGTSPSTTGSGSPVEAPDEKPVLLRASQEIPYVGLGAYAKRAAEAAARRRHQQRRPRYRTARPDAADDALRAFAGRAKRAASSDKPQQLDVLKVGALARQDLHINVGLPTRTPSSGLPTGFSATSSEEESVAPVPTKVKRSVDSTTSPAPIKSVDTASSPAPWRSPRTSLKSPGFVSPPSVKSPAVTKQQKLVEDTKKSIKEAIALGDADALKARTPTDGPSNLIRDVEEAEERYRAKEWEFEMKRAEFNLDLPPGSLAGNSEPAEPSAPPTTRSPAPTTRSPGPTRSPRPASPKRAASPRPRDARVSTQSFGCQADEENVPYGQIIVPTADKLPASKRRARDLLARQEHAAKALRALADLENVDDDSDDGMGDEGLIFDENVGTSFLHVSDVTGVRPAADVAASAAEQDLIRRAQQGPETRSPKLRGDDASPVSETFKMITPRGTLRERLEQMEAFADKLEVELDQGRERIEGFVEQMQLGEREINPMVLPSPRSPPPPPPRSLSSLASPPPPPLETASVERHALSNVQGAWGAYEELAAALDSPPPPKGPAHRTGTATARAGRRGGPRARRPPGAKRIGRDIW
jgi:hypothetical protein